MTPAATIHEKESITPKRGFVITEKSVTDGDESSGSTPVTDTGGPTPDDPEGSVTLSEWREGPHQVIERRANSTGEVRIPLLFWSGVLMYCFLTQVEVEVRRNVYAPENVERMTSRFAGGESEVRNAVGGYLRWLKEDAQKHAEGFMDDLRSAEAEIKRHFNPIVHNNTLDSQPAVEEVRRSPAESADEDGWASDNNCTRVSRSTRTKSLSKQRGFKKHIRPSTVETPNISREHSRAPGDRSSTPSPQPHGRLRGTGIPVSRTASWDMISSHHPRPASVYHPDSRRGSVRNLRIDSLRTAGMPGSPRELSPARSVRFVDSPPPRTSLPSQDDKGQDPSRKVAFELPSDKQ